MRIGIVSSALLQKSNRMDASYHLGAIERSRREVQKCERYLQAATTRLENARQKLAEEGRRAAALLSSGDLVPVDPQA